MKIYSDISDFPIYNWFKCIESKDYTYCLVSRKECSDKELQLCVKAFGDMYAQYIDEFGISEDLQNILQLQNKIAINKIELALTKDRSIELFIEMDELELDKLSGVKQSKGNSAKVAIEKMLGFQLNERTTSVKSYYEYINELKTENGRSTD